LNSLSRFRTAVFATLSIAGALSLSACAGATRASADAAGSATTTNALPLELHWFRNSAEYRATALEIYRSATARVTAAADTLTPGTWAVVLDVDETTLDNSEYQRRLARTHGVFADSTWYAWIRERAAPAIPGAVEYTRTVHALGGRVVLVSNRDDVVCDATRDNALAVGIPADLVLCRVNHVSDKVPRFEAVENGTAGMPPARIIQWVGDNILDFPGMTQSARSDPAAFEPFGRRYFMLPNPLYGSWQSNPEQ
jgi:5'-nucleotidase (lipoprotein e(P4) family)